MTSTLKKIDTIKNMAVFQDFSWDVSVRDKGNNAVEFKKINIFYGRNYSGKTTLSRIVRAMETGIISDKYISPEFQLSFDDGTNVTQALLTGHDQVIRVFNEDFVKENLHFIVDDEADINSFAILGEDNTQLEEKINALEIELGSEEDKSGLIGIRLETKTAFDKAKRDHDNKNKALEGKLRDKANKAGTGIKHNKDFGDANYNVNKITTDISTVSKDTYTPLTNKQEEEYRALLKEEPKNDIEEPISFDLKYSAIVSEALRLTEKEIQVSDPIQELLNNAALATWVRSGREYHKNKRKKCAFCSNDLPSDLWAKLDKHFNKESEGLLGAIEGQLKLIEIEKERVPSLLKIRTSDFYSNFSSDLEALKEQFADQVTKYLEVLELIEKQLEKRTEDLFTSLTFIKPQSVEEGLNSVRDSYEKLRERSNESTDPLSTKQSEACLALRLHEVFTFITDIKHSDELEDIKTLDKTMGSAKLAYADSQTRVTDKLGEIQELKDKIKDESAGAERVNDYLNNFFGHQFLSLQPVETSLDGIPSGYLFEVTRNGQKAFHLSEGECRLIAFCYFMAKLDDIETKGSQPIIWIDDPISSLDANHIFFVYSLIKAEIVDPKNYKQIFISTHSLDFLKYLKRISKDYKGKGENKVKIREFFLIERSGNSSCLRLMPDYLKEYVTEFNYLFHQIYKCSLIENVDDENYTTFYNFGNNARKFLEIYLYYRYPNHGKNSETLCRFFGGEEIPAILTDKINNEYSHLASAVERGALPIEAPEMMATAVLILQKIKDKDMDQYLSLLQSIGEVDEELSTIAQEVA